MLLSSFLYVANKTSFSSTLFHGVYLVWEFNFPFRLMYNLKMLRKQSMLCWLTSCNAGKLTLMVYCPLCLQSFVIWYSRGSFQCLRARSPDSTLNRQRKLCRSASRSQPICAPPPTAAERASCWAKSSPFQRCEDALLISWFHLPKPRESRVAAWHLTRDGSESRLKCFKRGRF